MASFTAQSKNDATYTAQSKNAAVYTAQSKNTAAYTAQSKNAATYTAQSKSTSLALDQSQPTIVVGVDLGSTEAVMTGQTFQTSQSGTQLSVVSVYITKTGAPADSISMSIYADGGTIPGTLLGTSNSVSGASLRAAGQPTTADEVSFTFSSPISLTANTTYWFVVSRVGSPSDTDYYVTAAANDAYANGVLKYYVSGNWNNLGSFDYSFKEYSISSAIWTAAQKS